MHRRLVGALLALGVVAAGTVLLPAEGAAGHVPPAAPGTLASVNPADHTPHAQNGDVRAYAQIGGTIYVGGSFTSVRAGPTSGWTARSYLFAFDESTGAIRTDFAPRLDGTVHALAVGPDGKLIVGGAFATVNGVARRNLVKLDPVTGATVAGWVGRADGGIVRRIVTHGSRVYIGGAFHWVNGTPHSLLARLDATTGAIDASFQIDAGVPRAGHELVWALALSPDGATLVAAGNFTRVNGLTRNQLVLVDVAGVPTVADWATERFVAPCNTFFPFYARDVDFSDDGSYFVVVADGGRGEGYCDAVSRWETSARGADVPATWVDYTGGDSVTAVEVTDGVVYVAGHFRWLNNADGNDAAGPGAVNRHGLGALDPVNGMPLVWNPGRAIGANPPAGSTGWGPIVWELWRGPAGLYVGQDSDGLGGEYHGRLGLFPTAGGRAVAVANAPQGTPGHLYVGAGDGQLTRVPFTGSALGVATTSSQPHLTSAGAAFAVSNKLYWVRRDPTAPSGSLLQVSMLTAGAIGAPWVGSGYNSWFGAAAMSGAFFLNGRMYFTVAGSGDLHYRYLEPDGSVVGCTVFTVPTRNLAWADVRGMTWVNGQLLYGSTDGALRSAPFDQSASRGYAVDGAAAVLRAAATAGVVWSSPTLFYATT